MDSIIQVSNLSKQFEDLKAVDDLSFSVERGDIYGFLGQNGAGKSTTIRMLLTLIAPTSGTISIFGMDLHRHRNEILRQTGAVVERPDLYKYLSAYDNLAIFARLSGIKTNRKRLMEHLNRVGLADRHSSKVKTFSQGMKQRLGIAVALVHDPKLLILDEPTNGLDPQGIADMRQLILQLSREEGKTIIISSHLLSEIELIANRMIIINKGKKITEGKVNELLDPAHTSVLLKTSDNTTILQRLQASGWDIRQRPGEQYLMVQLHQADIAALAKEVHDAGVGLVTLQPRHSLEDYFLSLTNHEPHVAAPAN